MMARCTVCREETGQRCTVKGCQRPLHRLDQANQTTECVKKHYRNVHPQLG